MLAIVLTAFAGGRLAHACGCSLSARKAPMASSACAAAFNLPMLPGNPCGIPIHTSALASTPAATARSTYRSESSNTGSSRGSAMQLGRDLRNLGALVARSDEFVCARHTRAITTGNRRGTIRRPTGDLVERHLTRVAIVEADNY